MGLALTSAGAALAVSDAELPDADALPLSLLWTQGVCRAQHLSMGTESYFRCASAEMGRIAWNVTSASTTRYSNSSEETTTADAMLALGGKYLLPDQQKMLRQTFDHLMADNPGDKLDNFMSTWWKGQAEQAAGTVFAVAPASVSSEGLLTTTLSYLSFQASFDSWQSFFASRVTSETQLFAQHVQLSLNAGLWRLIQGDITQKLGAAAIASIQQLDL